MNDTIKSRIQLKNDTEENWNKAGPKDGKPGFIPRKGELIIYNADSSNNDNARPFPRLKVGDGITNVVALPFFDAGSINGMTSETLVAQRTSHTLTFGAGQEYKFDGSQDVTVPVYNGTII